MQLLFGVAAAAAVVFILIMLFNTPFPHRARTPERLAQLVGELYYRGEPSSYATVVYRLGKASRGTVRVSKEIVAQDDVRLVISVPVDTRDARLIAWSEAGTQHSDPESATSALLALLTDTLGADLASVLVLYYGLSPASDSIGWTKNPRYHQ